VEGKSRLTGHCTCTVFNKYITIHTQGKNGVLSDCEKFCMTALHCKVVWKCFPEFPKLLPVLQTCSIYEFVYDHVCFCVYVSLLHLSSCVRENMRPLCF
jgi:hypothetical protein